MRSEALSSASSSHAQAATVATEVSIDTNHITAVPCMLVPPGAWKQVLALLRDCGWHPANNTRLILDRRPGKVRDSFLAIQLSDGGACALERILVEEKGGTSLERSPQENILVGFVRDGVVMWRPHFPLHEYLVDEERCDTLPPLGTTCESSGTDESRSIIRYIPAHDCQGQRTRPSSSKSERGPVQLPSERTCFRFAELFSGIGGFRLGLEAWGGECVFASEINPWARAIYALNFGGKTVTGNSPSGAMNKAERDMEEHGALHFPGDLHGNIQKIALEEFPDHDVLTAGFPCQPFTHKVQALTLGKGQGSGYGRGFRDPRGQVFWHVIRVLRKHQRDCPERQPKVVLLENVPGLFKNDITRPRDVSALAADVCDDEDDGSVDEDMLDASGTEGLDPAAGGSRVSMTTSGLPCVLSALSASGYSVSWKVYDARSLIPQMRERVYIVGIRNDLAAVAKFIWPELPELQPQLSDVLQNGEADGVDLEQYRVPHAQWVALQQSQYFQKHPEHRVPNLNGLTNTVRGSYRSGSRLYSQFVPMPLPALPNCNTPTLDAEGPRPLAPIRFLTPRECARLQGFPDTFVLSGEPGGKATVPENAQYQAVGNAVPPPLVQTITQGLMDAIRECVA